jgi:hypothetical protein
MKPWDFNEGRHPDGFTNNFDVFKARNLFSISYSDRLNPTSRSI